MSKGTWSKKLSKKEVSERMRQTALQRWSKIGKKERRIIALRMVEARRTIKL